MISKLGKIDLKEQKAALDAKAKTDARWAEISRKLYKVMDKNDRMQEKLQKLHDAYAALSENDDSDIPYTCL